MVPYLEPVSFIGLCGNSLTTSKINDFLSKLAPISPPIFIRQSRAWYVKYAALHGASFGGLRCTISSTLSKWWRYNIVFGPKMTVFSMPLAVF